MHGISYWLNIPTQSKIISEKKQYYTKCVQLGNVLLTHDWYKITVISQPIIQHIVPINVCANSILRWPLPHK